MSATSSSRPRRRPSPHGRRVEVPVSGLFEAHLTVTDLPRAIAFYRDRLGFPLAHVAGDRMAAFFWIGRPGGAMLGLWTVGSGPQSMSLHVAFRTALRDVVAAPRRLRSAGITPLDFHGRPSREPSVIAWMPAAAVFFRDEDGHLLEFLAMLPGEPQPGRGVVPWRAWRASRSRVRTPRDDERRHEQAPEE